MVIASWPYGLDGDSLMNVVMKLNTNMLLA